MSAIANLGLECRNEQTMSEPRVVIVTFPTAQILDVTGPLEVFSSASRFLPTVRYRTQVVSSRGGGPVMASCGLEFATTSIAAVRAPVDTLVVAGAEDMDAACADEDLLLHVRRLAPQCTARHLGVLRCVSCSLPPDCSTDAGPPPTGPTATY